MNSASVIITGAAGCLLAAGTTPLLGRLALRWGFTDQPGGHKVHERPIPYLGGMAVMLGTIVPPAVLTGLADERTTAIMIAAMAVALLGLIDDISSLSPLTRLAVEAVAAVGVVVSGVQATVTGSWLDGPITVLWIVVITNSFNLLDNMDGALGTVAAVSAAFLAGMAFVHLQLAIGLLLVALAHASLGFLLHNWAPAKVFMGDAGSLFIGFVIACSAALLVTGHSTGTVIAGLLLPTFVATVDTGVVILSRKRAGRPLLQGGTDHVSHRLLRLGLSTRLTAAILAAVAAVTGTLGLAMALGWISPLIATVAAIGAALILINLPQRVRVYSPVGAPNRPAIIRERRR
ncbi:MraY family glycosyltransferase [Streptosporangium roseum]|uniref:Glycosyl transferase n=1 Tax=Streptosporangium roseum (strain ATCC 12428 / DSM 43021 / JCM 3005 / KCTC 9067 / NCIMB 10171 / NRRL 2505 / NI 9100) TaxID=479432 RepID=D2B1Z8_STRRD|nr:MraY family glycosyltransferase [Streptosporangium roseum]ACZ89222.1 glycosyl transferase [Streptosporangium roseum DSM 43021]